MIFVLIAGSYTPFCLIPLRGGWGWGLFGVVWGLTVAGIILKTCAAHVPRKITALIYVSMGWLSIFFIYPLVESIPFGGLIWLFAGGLLYTFGALLYALKWPNPWPRFFGFHEIWHCAVMSASFCHFWVIYQYLIYI